MENGEDEILMLALELIVESDSEAILMFHLRDILVSYAKEVNQEIIDNICGLTDRMAAIRELTRNLMEPQPVIIPNKEGGKDYLRVDYDSYHARATMDRFKVEIDELHGQFITLHNMGVLPGLAYIQPNFGNTPD